MTYIAMGVERSQPCLELDVARHQREKIAGAERNININNVK